MTATSTAGTIARAPARAARALTGSAPRRHTQWVKSDLLVWGGGALVVVAGVIVWLFLTAPGDDILATTYRFGVL